MELARRKGDAQVEEALKHISDELHGRLDGAEFKLAELYLKGDEVPADSAAAIALYTELAKLDNRQSAFGGSAQFALCLIYGQGQGVTPELRRRQSVVQESV